MPGEILAPQLSSAETAGILRSTCRNHHVKRLMLFGSTIRGADRPDSDLDIIVEFYPGKTPGFAFAKLAEELSLLLGRKVDLHTPGSLSRYFREEVMREAQVIYASEE